MFSLTARLLIAGSIVLASFLGITGYTLDHAFRDQTEQSLRERLQAHGLGLIASAELADNGQIYIPDTLPESRYNHAGSGLYAQITSNNGQHRWQSPSMHAVSVDLPGGAPPGEKRFQRLMADGHELYAFAIGVTFGLSEDMTEGYTFSVAEDMASYYAQVADFRQTLWGWLGGVAVLLLTVQGAILHWSLTPLRKAAQDLAAIESGKQRQLESHYPRELRGLTDNLNALLAGQREHLERYRHTLSDLAHSLKTPLAVLQGEVERAPASELRASASEQVERMIDIVDYQLQRAATSGRVPLAAPVNAGALIGKMAASLNKVYADKQVMCEIDAEHAVDFAGDEGDLLELLGNLMDNAYKWSRRAVTVTARAADGDSGAALLLIVEDDGPGIPADKAQAVVQRGVRGDTSHPGHGIGLAIVQDIVRLYGGSLTIGTSALGGARVTVSLPQT